MTDEPNIKNDDRLAGGGGVEKIVEEHIAELENLREVARLEGNYHLVNECIDKHDMPAALAARSELAALRQRCEAYRLADESMQQAHHEALTRAEQAERERDENRLWRNRWIDSRTCDIQRESGMSYEEARCEAEYAANEIDARFKAATERHAALAHDARLEAE